MAYRLRYVAATVTVVAIVVVLGLAAVRSDPEPSTDASGPTPTASAAPTAEATDEPATDSGSHTRSGPDVEGQTPTAGDTTGDADSTPTAEPTAASELSDDETTSLPGLPGANRGARREREARAELRGDFPALSTRRGALAQAHPGRNVPVPGAAEVRSSSLSSEGDVTQVDLVVRMPGSLDRSLRFYRTRLSRVGFTESPAPPAASGEAASFRRRRDSVTLVARSESSGTMVTLHAVLHTDG